MLIKTFITERTEIKKNIELPYYSKESDNVFYRIAEDESVLKVSEYGSARTITVSKPTQFSTATWLEEAAAAKECSKEEVEEAVKKAIEFMDEAIMTV